MDGGTLLEMNFSPLTLKFMQVGWTKSFSCCATMPMDIIMLLIQSSEGGLIFTLFCSNCVHSSRYVVLGHEADGHKWLLAHLTP